MNIVGFLLSFLGIRFAGFRRQNRFLSVFAHFRYSRFLKHSIKYLLGCLVSLICVVFSFWNIKCITITNDFLTKQVLHIKQFANTLSNFPKNIKAYFVNDRKLKEEIENLRFENDKLKIAVATQSRVAAELEALKKASDFKYNVNPYRKIEKVLGFDQGITDSYMLISVTHKNIKVGNIVISSEGLVGIIQSVHKNLAKVIHIYDARIKVPVKTQAGTLFILEGDNNRKMITEESPRTPDGSLPSDIKIGIELKTSGEGGLFPPGIPVARISNIKVTGLEARAISSLETLSFVWIIEPQSLPDGGF